MEVLMQSSNQLQDMLHSINRKSYPGIIPAAPGIPCGRFPPARGTCWTKPFIP